MKMLKKEAEQRQTIEMLCTDMLVPKEHLLRKIDAAVDFTHVYDLVEDLYCEDNGRPSCDPVVLFKLVLIQHLFGIRSLRQTMRDAEVNVAYRWFLGYTMSQNLPHFATISYAFCHRFTAEVIEGVFRWILEEVARAGYLSPEVVFVDGTHIKANANLKKRMGCSLVDALIQHRLQKAHGMLHDTTRTLQEISHACGFNSVNYFSRQFRKHYGYAPSRANERLK